LAAAGCGGTNYPKCEKDKDCKDKEFCVQGLCQQCRYQTDCPIDQDCNAGRCDVAKNYCKNNTQCPPDKRCIKFRCVDRPESSTPNQSTSDSQATPGAGSCALEPIYFSFDSDYLDPVAKKALDANAKCIRDRSLTVVRITGYTDPRGTEEYNLALGDRRSRSTAAYLRALVGGEKVQTQASSVGEEMARGTEESSWSKDRKAEIQTP